MRVLAAGVGPGGAAPAGAPLLRAGGAGRRLRPAAPLHPHALRPVLLPALRLAAARPPRLGAPGAALPSRPARPGCLRRGGRHRCLAQPPAAGLLRPALRAQVRPFGKRGGDGSGHRWGSGAAVLGRGERGGGLSRPCFRVLPLGLAREAGGWLMAGEVRFCGTFRVNLGRNAWLLFSDTRD